MNATNQQAVNTLESETVKHLRNLNISHALKEQCVKTQKLIESFESKTAPECPACENECERGWIEMDNNGPIVPCWVCNKDGKRNGEIIAMTNPQTTVQEILLKCKSALEAYIETEEAYEGDEPLRDHGGLTWNQINEEFLKIKNNAKEAVASIEKYMLENAHD